MPTPLPTPLIDIGVNLTNRAFQRDLPDVIARARAADVSRMVVTGISMPGSEQAVALARMNPGVLYATAGVHPHNAKSCTAHTMERIRALAADDSVVAIGECGLDFDRDYSPRAVQLEWFERQVELAVELEMPLFLHEREATQEMVEIVSKHRSNITRAVLHCFTGNRDAFEAYLELDLHIGITGWICDERRGMELRELVGLVREDRLMVETDAPFLLPRTIEPKPKEKRNEPALLPHVVAMIAECTGRSIEQVAAESSRTAERFFALPAGGVG